MAKTIINNKKRARGGLIPLGQDYVPLHAHNDYSLLDGYGSLKKNVKYAAEMGFESIASTEHGTVSSFWDLKNHVKNMR